MDIHHNHASNFIDSTLSHKSKVIPPNSTTIVPPEFSVNSWMQFLSQMENLKSLNPLLCSFSSLFSFSLPTLFDLLELSDIKQPFLTSWMNILATNLFSIVSARRCAANPDQFPDYSLDHITEFDPQNVICPHCFRLFPFPHLDDSDDPRPHLFAKRTANLDWNSPDILLKLVSLFDMDLLSLFFLFRQTKGSSPPRVYLPILPSCASLFESFRIPFNNNNNNNKITKKGISKSSGPSQTNPKIKKSSSSSLSLSLSVGAKALAKHYHRSVAPSITELEKTINFQEEQGIDSSKVREALKKAKRRAELSPNEKMSFWREVLPGKPRTLTGGVPSMNEKANIIFRECFRKSHGSWINFHTSNKVQILEIRMPRGYGLRWSIEIVNPDDPNTSSSSSGNIQQGNEKFCCVFRGFVEPPMENGHLKGWRHY